MGDLSPMEGVELLGSSFPLSLDRRLAEGDQYRRAKEQLEATLLSIEQHYASQDAGPHQPPSCPRCLARKQDIARVYREYYLSSDPEAWHNNLPAWDQRMGRMFENVEDPIDSIDQLQIFYLSALRAYLKQDICSPHPTDNHQIANVKSATVMRFGQIPTPIAEVLKLYMDGVKEAVGSWSPPALFLQKLQSTKTAEDRVQAYLDFYCAQLWDERGAEVKNFKAKYATIFRHQIPHDEVLAAMKKEAEDIHMNKINQKRGELSELQMAQSAHLKNKARKAEKDQMMLDREPSPSTPMIADCGFDGCPVELDLAEENIECAVCEWLVAKDPASYKRRTYYCSVEHAEEDFEQHESRHHKCCMGDRCTNYPNAGPPGETEAGGICQQCTREFAEEGREGQTPFFYFCSEDCYRQNLDHHRKDMHLVADHPGAFEVLERFRPAQDMELVS